MSAVKKKIDDSEEQYTPWKPLVDYDDGVRRYRPEDMPHFRKIIEEKIEKIKKELGYLEETSLRTVEEYSGDNSTYSLHMADQGTDAQEREKAFLFAQREHKFLKHLYAALDRMEKGTYGYCMDTGIPIEYARLEAVPHATLSIAAKKKREEQGL
ncbi:MAG TPA: TraR/DksA family transcriptional regulator [Bacteroidetes bacterium]|nr:TraR/DksA family transcriptional regulator [Bacteroidota bacterium]